MAQLDQRTCKDVEVSQRLVNTTKMSIPFAVDCSLEYERVRGHEAVETP